MTTQIDFRTMPANVPVLCIPRVYSNISEQRIRRIFEDLNMGTLDRIDIVGKNNVKGDKFNRVYVHFRRWNDSENACIARERLLNGKEIKIIYDDPWFWKISAYRETERHRETDERKTEKPCKPTLQLDYDDRRTPRDYDRRRRPPQHDNRRQSRRDQDMYERLRTPLKNQRQPEQNETPKVPIEDNPDTNPVDPNLVINYGDIRVPKRRKTMKKQAAIKIEDTPLEEGEIEAK
jgi:hypothetical protein